jgi:archaellum component FlaC
MAKKNIKKRIENVERWILRSLKQHVKAKVTDFAPFADLLSDALDSLSDDIREDERRIILEQAKLAIDELKDY